MTGLTLLENHPGLRHSCYSRPPPFLLSHPLGRYRFCDTSWRKYSREWSERARHSDLLLPVEEGVETAGMKSWKMRRLREVDTDRRNRRGVRVMGERGFMHKLRSAIDGHREECIPRLCVAAHLINKTLVTPTWRNPGTYLEVAKYNHTPGVKVRSD